MGLVMQEPTLFNYSIKDNILYGKQNASNQEIFLACDVANARDFIEVAEKPVEKKEEKFDDSPEELIAALKKEEFKSKVIAQVGARKYDEFIKKLEEL